MDVSIKQTDVSDIAGVAELFDAYRMFFQQPSNLALARDFLGERLALGESLIFHAHDGNGRYLGFAQLYPGFSSITAQRTWLLNDLFVADSARGLGIGKRLLEQVRAYVQASGAKGVALETGRGNLGAQRLYESLGYVRDDSNFSYFLTLNRA